LLFCVCRVSPDLEELMDSQDNVVTPENKDNLVRLALAVLLAQE